MRVKNVHYGQWIVDNATELISAIIMGMYFLYLSSENYVCRTSRAAYISMSDISSLSNRTSQFEVVTLSLVFIH
jgi:hypothetical protein